MEFYQIPEGDGQEIYVEKDELMLKDDWIDKENKRIIFPELPKNESNPVYDAYREMFMYFYIKGYKVITDSETVSDDAFYFTPCLDKHKNETREDYVSNKLVKIKHELDSACVEEPLTMKVSTDGFFKTLPLPFVLKNMEWDGGENKYLIKTPEQLEVLRRFYLEINDYAKNEAIKKANEKYKRINPYSDEELIFDEKGHCDKWLSLWFRDYQKYIRESVVMQEYIKTPTKYNTSLRVMTSSSGDILAASLKYAEPKREKEKQEIYFDLDDFLDNPSSPYYLNSESIISNTVAGGNSILLGKDNYTEEERDILASHEIDPDVASVPESVYNAAIGIAVNCKRELGAISGIDFIFDDEEKCWKYLEEHEYPMLYSYALKYGIPYDMEMEDFYTVNRLVDMDARLSALKLTMDKKKQKLASNQDGVKLK